MIEINVSEKIDNKKLKMLIDEINSGKIFIFPTSTLYGIGCSAFNEGSIRKIFDIKSRPYSKPLIVLASNLKMVKRITSSINKIEEELMKKFWPGNLTIILKKSDNVPDIVTSSSDYVGVRIDENSFLNNLIEKSGTPLVAPSANITGDNCVNDYSNLNIKIKESVDYCLNGGLIENGMCSTLVKVEKGKVKILREGKIKAQELTNKGFFVTY